MSNNIGLNYLTKQIINYYGKDYKRYHVIRDERKHPLPRYYRKKLTQLGIYTEESLKKQTDYIQQIVHDTDTTSEQNYNDLHWNDTQDYREYQESAKIRRWNKLTGDTQKRNKI